MRVAKNPQQENDHMKTLALLIALSLAPITAIAQYEHQYELIETNTTVYPPIRENVAGPFNSLSDCTSAEVALGPPPTNFHYLCWML